jgi:hypothetical protein
MRFRGVSITLVGAATLLTLATPVAGAQRGRIGVLRPAPRPSINGALPRLGFISPHFFTSCFIAPSFSPFFPFFGGGVPFVNIQIFTSSQPSPDPSSHLAPDPSAQPVAFPGSHPLPGVQPVPGVQPAPGMQPAPGAVGTQSVQAFAAPVYSAPVYAPPVYVGAAPIATPHVSGGMVVGEVIDDPTFGFFGGGVVCVPTRFLGRTAFAR